MTHEEIFIIQAIVLLVQIGGFWFQARKLKPEIQKTRAEEQSALGDAVEGAGKTLDAAWKRIGDLERWKSEAQGQLDTLRDELQKWRNYAARLIRRLREVDPHGEIPAFDTKDTVKSTEVKQ